MEVSQRGLMDEDEEEEVLLGFVSVVGLGIIIGSSTLGLCGSSGDVVPKSNREFPLGGEEGSIVHDFARKTLGRGGSGGAVDPELKLADAAAVAESNDLRGGKTDSSSGGSPAMKAPSREVGAADEAGVAGDTNGLPGPDSQNLAPSRCSGSMRSTTSTESEVPMALFVPIVCESQREKTTSQ